MAQLLTNDDIVSIGKQYVLLPEEIKTIGIVEASGCGFDLKTGKIKIQFEPAYFQKYTRTKIMNGVELQPQEWEAYNKAAAINAEDAMLSTSWGKFQIMGFNYKECGYSSVSEMVGAFKLNERNQLEGFCRFVRSNQNLYNAIKRRDWVTVARIYNGPNYVVNQYDIKLGNTFKKLTEKC